MTTTTSYGTWVNHGDQMSVNVETSVYEALGSYADDYNVDAIVAEYRDAINDALPTNVNLCGDEFIGPAYPADQDFDAYPTDDDGNLDLHAIVESIDFWAIAARHDRSA
jgi:hypothetical protein